MISGVNKGFRGSILIVTKKMFRKVVCFFFILFFLLLNLAYSSNTVAKPIHLDLVEVSSISTTTGSHIVDVWIRDNLLYVINDFQGLQIYNVSDPSSPVLLGSSRDSYTYTHSIFVEGDFAYTADYEDGFEVVNISDITHPEIVGKYTSGAGITAGSTSVFKLGNLGFLASQTNGLELINCSDPCNPTRIGRYYANERVIRVYATDELVFLSEAHNGFKIFELDSNNITLIYHFTDTVSYQDFFVHKGLLYTTNTEFGLKIFDISNPRQIMQIGEKNIGRSHGLVIKEENGNLLAFVATWESGLQILDVGDPTEIIIVAQYNDGGENIMVTTNNDYVYVAEFSYGLEILKINTPEDYSTSFQGFESFLLILGGLVGLIILKIQKKR